MSTQHGFDLLTERHIAELNSTAKLYRHIKSGAQFLSVENDDENKVFGVSFFTPSNDSTGIAHIMEHAVLCGSRKYPLKEPFVELLKSSLKTFLNAMTYQDKTVYPVASQNVRDLYNLIDVYLDAVFYPRIPAHVLEQEGWHYELDNPNDPLMYKGVVFNEMKGALSSPDTVLQEYSQQSLYPGTIYGVNSGGDPREIPNLTYANFKAFHEKFYHPSNAQIFFYGDDDPGERLRYLDSWLSAFEAHPSERQPPQVERFAEPRRMVYGYAASAEDTGEDSDRCMVQVNWLIDAPTDSTPTSIELRMGLGILSFILLDSPASPLYKALIESGLGEDVIGGLERELSPMNFSTGMKGIQAADADNVEALIFNTLRDLVSQGIEPDMIEAAINTIEFRLRENNTGGFPRGLGLMLRTLSVWLYNGDPLAALAFEAPLSAVKARLAKGERYFETLIEQFLLSNSHRTTVLLKPDAELQAKLDEQELDRLAKVKESLSESDLKAIIDNTRLLKQLQVTPDSPEALAAIPTLKVADLDRQNKTIPVAISDSHGSQVLYHDLFTNGIVYLDVGMNLHTLPPADLPYLDLFSRALTEMGTATEDFVRLAQRIGRKTGGLRASTFVGMPYGGTTAEAWLMMRGKCTMTQVDDLLAIIRDVLLTVNLDNRERFRQLVLEEKSQSEAGLVPSGHLVALTRLNAAFSEADWANEVMGGVTNLFFLRQLAEQIDSDWPSVRDALERIRRTLVNRARMVANVTLDAANWAAAEPKLHGFLKSLPSIDAAIVPWHADLPTADEGLTIPSQVNFVSKGANLYRLGYDLHGSHMAITKLLNNGYLWERVRVQGGAYGGFSTFNPATGNFAMLSYRDPNLLSTLDNYTNAATFLGGLEIDQEEVDRTIIGAIGDMDSYQLPDAKGWTSLVRHLTGYTDAMRQQRRDELLGTTIENFHQFGETLAALNEAARVVVVGSADGIEAANAAMGSAWSITKVL